MQYEVVASNWWVKRQRFRRGDTISADDLAGLVGKDRIDGFRRLGFIRAIEADLSKLTKAKLLDVAHHRGIEVPASATKARILELLKE